MSDEPVGDIEYADAVKAIARYVHDYAVMESDGCKSEYEEYLDEGLAQAGSDIETYVPEYEGE